MTAEQVVDYFAPHPSTAEVVMEWLVASGISADRFAISANKQVAPPLAPHEIFGMVQLLPSMLTARI